MTKIPCDVIKDVLPLYYDQVCSAATKDMVETHLEGCEDCKWLLGRMKADIGLPLEAIEQNKLEGSALQSVKASWKRSKAAAFMKGFVIAASVCALLVLGYIGLFRWNITTVPADVIQITEVSLLQNGKIAYHVKMTDGYDVNQINFKLNSDGNFYMTPVRPIIKSKKFADIGLANRYDNIDLDQFNANKQSKDKDVEIKAVYYGSPKDAILVWKKGMDLPPASEAIEAQFDFGD